MFKFLDPLGCTYYNDEVFQYDIPQQGRKWSDWTEHPLPAKPDGEARGSGRLYLMKSLNANYAPPNWWPWWAQGRNIIGEDKEKAAYSSVRLRRIFPKVLARALRPPFNWGKGADLRGICLRWADLRGADLRGANLYEAALRGACLQRADLRWANLRGADLRGADLHEARLCGAKLCWADLRWVDLSRTHLRNVDLSRIQWDEYTIWPDGFNPALE